MIETVDGDGLDCDCQNWDGQDWEYQPLRLPPEVSRWTAATQLAVQAEFAGWELSRVRMYSDGTRSIMLRRQRTAVAQPQLSL